VKVEVGVGKGKKLHDKRRSIQDREAKRQIDRAMKGR
jgi:SsrA-binding protein